jgi:hypothetical protein
MFQDFHLQYVIANPALTRQIGMDIAWIFKEVKMTPGLSSNMMTKPVDERLRIQHRKRNSLTHIHPFV